MDIVHPWICICMSALVNDFSSISPNEKRIEEFVFVNNLQNYSKIRIIWTVRSKERQDRFIPPNIEVCTVHGSRVMVKG